MSVTHPKLFQIVPLHHQVDDGSQDWQGVDDEPGQKEVSLLPHGAVHEERVGEEQQEGGEHDQNEVETDLLEVGEVVEQAQTDTHHIG